jgi:Ca2+-binding EF-hand superfamily protein
MKLPEVRGKVARSTIRIGREEHDFARLAEEHGLAKHELAELYTAFRAIDADGSGTVDVPEVKNMLECAIELARVGFVSTQAPGAS